MSMILIASVLFALLLFVWLAFLEKAYSHDAQSRVALCATSQINKNAPPLNHLSAVAAQTGLALISIEFLDQSLVKWRVQCFFSLVCAASVGLCSACCLRFKARFSTILLITATTFWIAFSCVRFADAYLEAHSRSFIRQARLTLAERLLQASHSEASLLFTEPFLTASCG
jgi:hypothetical protein